MKFISLHTQCMATAGILITLGPARIYYMWAIAQAVLSGHENFFVCAGPPPVKRVICFSLAGLQTVPVCYIPLLFLSTSPFTQLCPICPLLLVLTLLLLFSETPTPPCYCPPHCCCFLLSDTLGWKSHPEFRPQITTEVGQCTSSHDVLQSLLETLWSCFTQGFLSHMANLGLL